jgi:hypothetical protein
MAPLTTLGHKAVPPYHGFVKGLWKDFGWIENIEGICRDV